LDQVVGDPGALELVRDAQQRLFARNGEDYSVGARLREGLSAFPCGVGDLRTEDAARKIVTRDDVVSDGVMVVVGSCLCYTGTHQNR